MEGFNSVQLDQIEAIVRKVLDERDSILITNRATQEKKGKKSTITKEEHEYLDSLVQKTFFKRRQPK